MTNLTKVSVIFRKWPDGTIDALMPYEVDVNYTVTCYSRVGQHSVADYDYCLSVTKLASPNEYNDLLLELNRIGYHVTVIKRANRYKMSRAWRDLKLDHSKLYSANTAGPA